MKVPVVFPFFAHYREGVAEQLCRNQEHSLQYELISGRTANQASIKLLDEERAQCPISQNRLGWKFVKNFWLGKAFLWQSKVWRLPFKHRHGVIIFMGVSYYFSTMIAMVISKITKTRVLLWTHGYLDNDKSLKNLYRRFFYSLADGFLLYGNRAKDIMIEKGFDPDSLYVIYNSLPYARQKKIRDNIKQSDADKLTKDIFPNQHPILLWSGRLIEGKKIPMLFSAVAELKGKGNPVNLLLIGDGPMREKFINKSRDLNIEDYCHFYGPCYDEEKLAGLFTGSDLCVSPGPIGLMGMHSLTYGLPVLTNNTYNKQKPEVEAIIDGKTGAFFQEDNLNDLVKQIIKCLNTICHDQENTRQNCHLVIDKYYNPIRMVAEINQAVLEQPPSTDKPTNIFEAEKS